MRNDIKLGIYVAAGVGVYAILKRYGILEDVGRWLSDQVPEDLKRQAAHATKEVRQRVGDATGYVRDQAEKLGGEVKERAEQAVKAGNGVVEQFTGGKREETSAPDGSSAVHKVGRGVTH